MSFRADMLFWASIILRYVCHSGQTSSFWAELVILNKLNCHSVLDLSFWTTTFSPSDGTLLTDMRNRVEHQKRNQPAIEKWPFGFVFGVQLGLRQTQALIKTKQKPKNKKNKCSFSRYSSWFESVIVSAEGRVEHQKRN